jgi:hypothetical protein
VPSALDLLLLERHVLELAGAVVVGATLLPA